MNGKQRPLVPDVGNDLLFEETRVFVLVRE
jgi:hypothetical protein